jgi:hypothetical protein
MLPVWFVVHPPLNGFSRLSDRDTDPNKLAFFAVRDGDDGVDPPPLLCCITDM